MKHTHISHEGYHTIWAIYCRYRFFCPNVTYPEFERNLLKTDLITRKDAPIWHTEKLLYKIRSHQELVEFSSFLSPRPFVRHALVLDLPRRKIALLALVSITLLPLLIVITRDNLRKNNHIPHRVIGIGTEIRSAKPDNADNNTQLQRKASIAVTH